MRCLNYDDYVEDPYDAKIEGRATLWWCRRFTMEDCRALWPCSSVRGRWMSFLVLLIALVFVLTIVIYTNTANGTQCHRIGCITYAFGGNITMCSWRVTNNSTALPFTVCRLTWDPLFPSPPISDQTYEGACRVTEFGSCEFLARAQFGTSIVIGFSFVIDMCILVGCCMVWWYDRRIVVHRRTKQAVARRKLPEVAWLMATHHHVGQGTPIHTFVNDPLFDYMLLRLIFDHYDGGVIATKRKWGTHLGQRYCRVQADYSGHQPWHTVSPTSMAFHLKMRLTPSHNGYYRQHNLDDDHDGNDDNGVHERRRTYSTNNDIELESPTSMRDNSNSSNDDHQLTIRMLPSAHTSGHATDVHTDIDNDDTEDEEEAKRSNARARHMEQLAHEARLEYHDRRFTTGYVLDRELMITHPVPLGTSLSASAMEESTIGSLSSSSLSSIIVSSSMISTNNATTRGAASSSSRTVPSLGNVGDITITPNQRRLLLSSSSR